ncbi:hypothetical protein CDIK_2172 [Cucumispora dikerogammari]|nr:hypothetical protein CDIK_2172 [Cucumispora dikerogammari]
MNYYYTKSQRGGDILVFNGFLYNKEKEYIDKTKWRCKKRGCPAIIYIYSDTQSESHNAHTHDKDLNAENKINLIESLMKRALESKARAKDIIVTETSKV